MKHVIVTGASSGIGLDACRYLLDQGYFIHGTVRKEEDKLRLESSFQENFEAIMLDVQSDDDIQKMGNKLKTDLQDIGLYGLVNNAGIATGGPMMHLDYEDFMNQMDINFLSIFKITNELLPLMGAGFSSKFEAGRIINISSVSGLINTPMIGPYCISKHALESMSDIYRRELAVYGIKVVLLEPGPIKTPIWEKSVPPENPFANTDYKNIFAAFNKEIIKSEKNALPVVKVSEIIYKALTKSKPRARYIVSRQRLMMRIIKNFIPDSLMDMIFFKQLKKHMYR